MNVDSPTQHDRKLISLKAITAIQRYQFPIMLAGAITIHTVQGLSLDRADLTAHACVHTLSPAASQACPRLLLACPFDRSLLPTQLQRAFVSNHAVVSVLTTIESICQQLCRQRWVQPAWKEPSVEAVSTSSELPGDTPPP